MARLLLNLRNVPDDEADEVRALLERRGIAFYETEPSFWGVSGGGIWVSRADDVPVAEQLVADYEEERRARARAEYRAARAAGTATLWASVRAHPLLTLAMLLGIAFILVVTLVPFIMLVV